MGQGPMDAQSLTWMNSIQQRSDRYFSERRHSLTDLIADAASSLEVTRMVLDHVSENVSFATRPYQEHIACRAGCDFCCHQLVMVKSGEAQAIQDAIALLPGVDQAVVRAQAEDQFRVISAAQQEAGGGLSVSQMTAVMAQAVYNSGMPCPLLDTSAGQCRIYESRPSACRAAYSFDAARCRDHFGYAGKPPRDPSDECGILMQSDPLIPSDRKIYPICVVSTGRHKVHS